MRIVKDAPSIHLMLVAGLLVFHSGCDRSGKVAQSVKSSTKSTSPETLDERSPPDGDTLKDPLAASSPNKSEQDQAPSNDSSESELSTSRSLTEEMKEDLSGSPDQNASPNSSANGDPMQREMKAGEMKAGEMMAESVNVDVNVEIEQAASERALDAGTVDDVTDSIVDSTGEDIQPPRELLRVFLPTTLGILIADLDLRIGEQTLAEFHRQRVQQVIADAGKSGGESSDEDSDADADVTWPQLFEFVASDTNQFGRNMVQPAQYKEMTRRYDSNLNKRPDPDEVARFLFRNAGYGGPFRLRGTNHYRQVNRTHSELFRAIDRDGDRVLTSDELAESAEALLRMDRNADRRIDAGEVATPQRNDDEAWKRRQSKRLGDVAMDLQGYVDWTMVSYSLDENRLSSPLGLERGAITQLDADADNRVSEAEAKRLLEVPADMTLSVHFADQIAAKPTIKVVHVSPELDSLVTVGNPPRAVSIMGQNIRVTFRADDAQGGQERIPQEAFDMLDANSDGGIDEDEFPDVGNDEFSFENLDANEDGKVTLDEINGRGRRPQAIWNAQVRGRAAEAPDALFTWLDENMDGFLSEREILRSANRLAGQHTQDLAVDDLPDAFVVQLVRGDPSQDQQNFQITPESATSPFASRRWAAAMDSNRDGEISKLEFNGTEQQFDDLDDNSDGFIAQSELAQSE